MQLTINSDLQWYLQQMIAEETQKMGAQAGTVTVVEVKTGKNPRGSRMALARPQRPRRVDPG